MKKFICVLLCLTFALSLPALAEDDVTGLWYLNKLSAGEMVMEPAALGLAMTMELQADGTLVITQQEEATTGTWAQDGEQLTITPMTESFPAALQDGNLVMDYAGGFTYTFGREPLEVVTYTPAEVNPAATLADMAGTWEAFFFSDADTMQLAPSAMGMTFTLTVANASLFVETTMYGSTITISGEGAFENGTLTIPSFTTTSNDVTSTVDEPLTITLLTDGVLVYRQVSGITLYCQPVTE